MTKKVKEIIKKITDDGLVDKIHKVLVKMKKDGDITTESEIPEHYGKIANEIGVEDTSDMSKNYLRAFINVVDRELEKIFGLKVFAGYFVTESFKAVSRRNFSLILESAVEHVYDNRHSMCEDENDDLDDDNTNDYYLSYSRGQWYQPKPYVILNTPQKIHVWNDDRTKKLYGYQRAKTFSDRGGGNTAYNGSFWMIRLTTDDGVLLSEKKIKAKREVIDIIYTSPEFTKAKQELTRTKR